MARIANKMCDVPYSTPGGIDDMPMKINLMPMKVDLMSMKVDPPSSVLKTCSGGGGGWETGSGSDAGSGSEHTSEGSWPTQPKRPAHTPLRSQAAPYQPSGGPAPAAIQRKRAGASVQGQRSHQIQVAAGQWQPPADGPTTVMLRNIPFCYTCDSLIDMLDRMGFSKQFDFVYMPINLREMRSVGYAFVNMITHGRAKQLMARFEGFNDWEAPTPMEPCSVRWSTCNGLLENIKRNQNSPIMVDSVPAICKPVLLCNGVRIPFPLPVKQPRKLRQRKGKAEEEISEEVPAVAV